MSQRISKMQRLREFGNLVICPSKVLVFPSRRPRDRQSHARFKVSRSSVDKSRYAILASQQLAAFAPTFINRGLTLHARLPSPPAKHNATSAERISRTARSTKQPVLEGFWVGDDCGRAGGGSTRGRGTDSGTSPILQLTRGGKGMVAGTFASGPS